MKPGCLAWLLIPALVACSESESSPAEPDAAAPCQPLEGFAYCDNQACFQPAEVIPDVCTREQMPQSPSAGLYAVCLVSPDGVLYSARLGGSRAVEGEGWRHSAYGGGTVSSTLLQSDEQRCSDASAVSPALQTDAGEVFCSGPCL